MISLILCAAGNSSRAGGGENKVLRLWNGLPVLCHALSPFLPYADEIVVSCRREDEERIGALLSPYPHAKTVSGGDTRFESVYHALQAVTGEYVLVHDAARPFPSPRLVKTCIDHTMSEGSAVCSLPSTDTAVLYGEEYRPLDRSRLFTLQTPQGYRTKELLTAFRRASEEGRERDFTDESGVFAAYIRKPFLFPGEPSNRKLTYAEDFLPAERVGFGIDTHAFAHQNEIDAGIARLNLSYIKLCGVTIPSNRAIEAHSDGDVAVHALMDALLSAIGERDIGFRFPDTDPAYRGADSMELLAEVMKKVHETASVKNISLSILCELPRLAPYIEAMRDNLRRATGCEAVAVAAGTNEKLGYIGEGRGITCYAMVLLTTKDGRTEQR